MVYGTKYQLLPNTSPDPNMNCLGIPGGNQLVRNPLPINIVCAAGKYFESDKTAQWWLM